MPSKKSEKSVRQQLRAGNNRRRKVSTKRRIAHYGVRNFARNTWLSVAATAVMTITLLVVFLAAIISQMLSSTVATMNEKVSDVTIFFKSETDDDTLRVMAGKMRLTENVVADSVVYENSKTVYRRYIEDNKDNPIKMEPINLLAEVGIDPSESFPAQLTLKVKDPNDLSPIKKLVENDADFQKWLNTDEAYKPSYDNSSTKNTIDTIISWSTLAQQIGLIAGSVFLLISILVIFNTIRMAIFSRREEIDMMKSIGADKHFIRGPFLIEAEMYGLFAAILATAIGYLITVKLLPGLAHYGVAVDNIEFIMNRWWFAIFGAMTLIGVSIGYVSAALAVRKYLK